MSDPEPVWDFYSCRVDDAPGSIFTDFAFERLSPPTWADTMYWVNLRMLHPGSHGMGDADEAAAVHPASNELETALAVLNCRHVGTLRNRGVWQFTYYGPAGLEAPVAARATTVLTPLARTIEHHAEPDSEWSYYHEFLLPDPKRRQWMRDRELVEFLKRYGDVLTKPRMVEHGVLFDRESDRDTFLVAAANAYPAVKESEAGADGRYFAVVGREDSVELEHIHEVAMAITHLAAAHHGVYDGWFTEIITAAKKKPGWNVRRRPSS